MDTKHKQSERRHDNDAEELNTGIEDALLNRLTYKQKSVVGSLWHKPKYKVSVEPKISTEKHQHQIQGDSVTNQGGDSARRLFIGQASIYAQNSEDSNTSGKINTKRET